MEKVIRIEELQSLGLLVSNYSEWDLLDAFLIYFIFNCNSDDNLVLQNSNSIRILDSMNYFKMGYGDLL